METAKDQCRKTGCPGCRNCLDIRNPEHETIIIYNELKIVEDKMKALKKELSYLEKEYFTKRALLNEPSK
jgi:hypothetical protein